MASFSVADVRQANLALSKALGEMDLRASLQDILRFGHESTPGHFGTNSITCF